MEITSEMSHVGLTSVTWYPISKNIQFALQNDPAFRPGELFNYLLVLHLLFRKYRPRASYIENPCPGTGDVTRHKCLLVLGDHCHLS